MIRLGKRHRLARDRAHVNEVTDQENDDTVQLRHQQDQRAAEAEPVRELDGIQYPPKEIAEHDESGDTEKENSRDPAIWIDPLKNEHRQHQASREVGL